MGVTGVGEAAGGGPLPGVGAWGRVGVVVGRILRWWPQVGEGVAVVGLEVVMPATQRPEVRRLGEAGSAPLPAAVCGA